MNRDEDHLRLLTVFHYVVAGLTALFALFPLFHLALGLFMVFAPDKFAGKGESPPVFVGWIFVGFAAMFIFAGWTLAALTLVAGRFLSKRRHYMFCLVMAAIQCAFFPFGTALGVFTLIVLLRDSVKQLFASVGTNNSKQ